MPKTFFEIFSLISLEKASQLFVSAKIASKCFIHLFRMQLLEFTGDGGELFKFGILFIPRFVVVFP